MPAVSELARDDRRRARMPRAVIDRDARRRAVDIGLAERHGGEAELAQEADPLVVRPQVGEDDAVDALVGRRGRGRWRAPAGRGSPTASTSTWPDTENSSSTPAMNEWKNGSAAMTSGLRPMTRPHAKDRPMLSDRARRLGRPAEVRGDLEDAVAGLGRDARAVVERERHAALADAGAARDIGDGRPRSSPSVTSSCVAAATSTPGGYPA